MGGYESLPNPVPFVDMVYQEVGRMQAGGYTGVEGSIPGYIEMGEPIYHNYTFTVPDNVLDIKNVSLIGLIVDNHNGEVVNASILPISDASSVRTPTNDDEIRVVKSGSTFKVIGTDDVEPITILSIDGTVITSNCHSNSIEVPDDNHRICILSIKIRGKYYYSKQLL